MSKLVEKFRTRARLVSIFDLVISTFELIICLVFVFKLSEWFVAVAMRRDMSGQPVDNPGTEGWIGAGIIAFVLLISFFVIVFQLNLAYGLFSATHANTTTEKAHSAAYNYSFASLIFILFIGVRIVGLQLQGFCVVFLLGMLILRCMGLALVIKYTKELKLALNELNHPFVNILAQELPNASVMTSVVVKY